MSRGTVSGNGIVTDGLVLALDAANPRSYVSGSTLWSDLTANNYTGSLVNGPTFSSVNGGSLNFDGSDDFVNFSYPQLDIKGSFTTEAWIINNFDATTYRTIVSWGVHTTNQDRSMWLQAGTGRLSLYFFPTQNNQVVGTSNVGNNKWHHCVATWDGSIGRVYVDTILEATSPLTTGSYTYTNTYIGKNIGGSYPFIGNIAAFKLYNRAITSAEVLQNYNATKTRFGLT